MQRLLYQTDDPCLIPAARVLDRPLVELEEVRHPGDGAPPAYTLLRQGHATVMSQQYPVHAVDASFVRRWLSLHNNGDFHNALRELLRQ